MAIYLKEVLLTGWTRIASTERWKNKDKAVFLIRLGKLLSQGYSLSDGLNFLKYHQKDHVQAVLDRLSDQLSQGEPLHERLEEIGFPRDVLGYLYFSERHGDLAFALAESGKMMEKREDLKERIRKLVRYPIFLLWMVTILIVFMMQYLFPQFRALYASLNVDFPWFTKMFLTLVDHTPIFFVVLFVLLLAAFLFYMTRFRTLHPRAQLSILSRFPLLRTFLPLLLTQYFAVQLSYLLKGALSIYEALTIFESQHHLGFFQQEASAMKRALRNGERFEDVLSQNPFFVKELSEVIVHGQMSGNLADELLHYSNLLMEMIESRANRALTVMQPALFAGVGTVVLMLFVSILLPIFHLLDAM